jgi:hypothetical protein
VIEIALVILGLMMFPGDINNIGGTLLTLVCVQILGVTSPLALSIFYEASILEAFISTLILLILPLFPIILYMIHPLLKRVGNFLTKMFSALIIYFPERLPHRPPKLRTRMFVSLFIWSWLGQMALMSLHI